MHFSLLAVASALLLAPVNGQECPAKRPTTAIPALPSSSVSTISSQASTAPKPSAEPTSSLSTSSSKVIGSTSAPSSTLTTSIKPSSASSSTIASVPTSSLSSIQSSISEPVLRVSSTETTSTTKPTSTSKVTTTTSSASSSSSAKPTTTSSKGYVPSAVPRAYPADVVDKLRDDSIEKLYKYLEKKPSSGGCTLEKASIRREWSDISVKEREDYIKAVQCLQSLPPKSSTSEVPGARSRFDDFLAVHMQQTDSIHGTANFLSWHRYYTWAYEQALRDECGYKGSHPYWNWDRYASDPANSPLFNGNSSSLSGNSVNDNCVASGPFKDMRVNLGPGRSLNYNPRCLKRNMSKWWAQFTTVQYSHPLITNSNNIGQFQDTMQQPQNVHAGGHFTFGGDPGSDIYTSPGDPAFYLHHAMIDRVWWIWQLQDLESRLHAVSGRVVGSAQGGSVSDPVALGVNAPASQIGNLLDTMDGPFCYIYA